MPMASYSTFQPDSKPWRVSICTSANDVNVRAFINELSEKFSDLALDVRYFSLPYNDIDHFTFNGCDVGIMIMCHSIHNRRFAITDVMDAIYDRFLPRAVRILGKKRICVIAHDFSASKGLDNLDKYQNEMDVFKSMQPTTFKTASQVMMAGKLDGPGPVELQGHQWEVLKCFIEDAARSPMPSPGLGMNCIPESMQGNKKMWIAFGIFLVSLLIIALGLGLGIKNSPSVGHTTPNVITSTPMPTPTVVTSTPMPTTPTPNPPAEMQTQEPDPSSTTAIPSTKTEATPKPTITITTPIFNETNTATTNGSAPAG